MENIVETYNYERKLGDNPLQSQLNLSSNLDKNFNAITNRNIKSCSQSSSSIEPQSDCSLTDPINDNNRSHISPSDSYANICTNTINQNFTDDDDDELTLNEYLKTHQVPLPTLSISSESADDEFVSIATSNGQEGTWEDNWLFKRKKLVLILQLVC